MTTTKIPLTKEEYDSMIVDAEVIFDNEFFLVHKLPDDTQVMYLKFTKRYYLYKTN